MFSYHGTNGRMVTALCGSPGGGAGGHGCWPSAGRCGPLAHWLGGQACWACQGGRGTSSERGAPVAALSVGLLAGTVVRTSPCASVLDAQTQNGDEPVGEYSFLGQSCLSSADSC